MSGGARAIGSQLYIKDILVECSPDDRERPQLNGIGLIIVDNQSCALDLVRVSKSTWKQKDEGVVPVPRHGFLLVASSMDFGDLARVDVNISHLSRQKPGADGRDAKKRFNWKLKPIEDAPLLSLSCNAYSSELNAEGKEHPEKGTLHQLPDYYPTKPDMLISYGDQFLRRFNNLTQNEHDIRMTMKAYQDAVSLLSANDSRLATFINDQGLAYFDRYSVFGEIQDLDEAMNKYRIAMAITPENHEYYPRWLNNLGNGFLMLFMRNGELTDLSEAIATHRRAIQLIPAGYIHLPFMLNNLGNTLLSRFEQTGELADMSESIELHRRAVELTPDDNTGLPSMLTNLSHSFIRRFERNADLEDLSESIRLQQRAIELTPSGHARLPSMLTSLGHAFNRRYYRTKELADISESVSLHHQAVQITPEGHADLPVMFENLADAYRIRHVRTGDLTDIQESIRLSKRAIELTPAGHQRLANMFSCLGLAFSKLFERTRQLDDISQSVLFQQQAAQLTPAGHTNLSMMLSNLGTALDHRFQQTGDLADNSESIRVHKLAVQLTPDDHPNLPGWLNSLGEAFTLRFQRTGDLADISEAIRLQRRAVQLTPEDHENYPSRLTSLGDSLRARYEQTGDLIDISEAIKLHQQALQLSPDGHSQLPSQLSNLGNSLTDRYEQTRDLADISDAIQLQQQGVKLTPEGHVNLPVRLTGLGSSFCYRFEETGNLSDINESIRLHQQALDLTSPGQPQLPLRLNNLGHSLFRRFEKTGELADLSESIRLHQQSVQLMPGDHRRLSACLNNLANSFLMRFSLTRDLADNSESIRLRERVVQLTPKGHPDLPYILYNLGNAFLQRFLQAGEPEAWISARSNFTECALSSASSPMVGILACKRLALFSKRIAPQEVSASLLLEAHERIIYLLSLIAGMENTLKRRHTLLVDSSELSTAAAAAALSVNNSIKALEWLEQGRCIVWNQINQLRLPVDDLRTYDPVLADRFVALSRQLENAGARTDPRHAESELSLDVKISLQDEAHNHLRLAKERDELLTTIRNIAGFENFLRPKRYADLVGRLPKDGSVVIINADPSRCDALVLTAGWEEPKHIPLEQFSYDRAKNLAETLRSHLRSHQLRTRYSEQPDDLTDSRSAVKLKRPDIGVDVRKVLRAMWLDLVEPILQSLGMTIQNESANLPRIWWCPTGPCAFLPIHAAGIYDDSKMASCPSVGKFVVSSYIPNLSILDGLRIPRSGKSRDGVLLVSQPNTPGFPKIPKTTEEVEKASEQLNRRGIRSAVYTAEEASVGKIKKSLESFTCIHLACHASQNIGDPLESAIHLYDGPLKLSELIQMNLPDAHLAFLSACQTSAGDDKLPEEAVHLAAGMLAVGYRSVVATMWSISDSHAPQVAEMFYQKLLSNGPSEEGATLQVTDSARALHMATQDLREKLGNSTEGLLAWIPYVHYGM